MCHEVDDVHPVATAAVPNAMGTPQPRPAVLATPDASEIDFAVDAVYTWVDDSDPAWRARRDAARADWLGSSPDAGEETAAAHRFRDRGELRASLRSLEMYAPWIRRVFLVTDRQRPDWLDPESSRVVVVDHTEIIEGDALPTFSSHVIGSQLHCIPGLAARYLVVNDDILFNRPVTPLEFFTPEGALKVVFSRPQAAGRRVRPDLAGSCPRQLRKAGRARPRTPSPRACSPTCRSRRRWRWRRTSRSAGPRRSAQTLSHPFRDAGDYEVNSWLHLYHALFTGRAVAGSVPFAYFNVGKESARTQMDDPASFARAMFVCVNDSMPSADAAVSEWLAGWLRRAYPVPGVHGWSRTRRPAAPSGWAAGSRTRGTPPAPGRGAARCEAPLPESFRHSTCQVRVRSHERRSKPHDSPTWSM